MDSRDKALLRASELTLEDITNAVEDELGKLVPILVEAGYASEEPWGKDYDESEGWSLWRFTPSGVKRAKELEDSN
jgi:hypothetical protein